MTSVDVDNNVLSSSEAPTGALGSMKMSRNVIFAIGWVLTCLTCGTLVTGFGPMYSRLVDEQQWHDLCPGNATDVCSAQEVQLQSVYSTGILMTVLGQTIFGALLDTIGPRYMTLVAYVFSIAGNVCMAYGDSHNGTDGLLVAGFALIGFGGMGILYASLQLSTLFKDPALYTGGLVAAMCASGYIYVLLESHVSRESFFLAYAILVAVCMVVVYFVFPVHHVIAESETVMTPGVGFTRPHIDKSKMKNLWTGLKVQLKRRDYWAFLGIGGTVYLILVYAGGAIPSIVTSLANGDKDKKNIYTNYLYPLVSNSSFIFAPIAGYVIHHFGFKMTVRISIAMFCILCGSFMLPSLAAQNLSFVLMAATYGFMNSIQYVYIMHCFPHELYGVLSGIVTLLVFAYCLLSYALTALAQYSFNGNNNYVFLILLGTTLLTTFFVRFLREESDCLDAELRLNFIDKDDEAGED
ncbi:Aste57867_10590 [Aphanomyces stellatus]|uniref:Aste57867_10590 protein n=1 Tax=Aphanomyces stellatus TaxID=120398 RepID=A0A485KQT7_9STRA|nr:hypothetical protein As57867_010550 [Aphanomyces stellatus]VFT87462.1 Aste57867_10590 [Aphanomyces stellatus]